MLSQPFQDAIRQRLSIPVHEGPDRTTTLEAALRQHVPAGATVYLGAAHGRPNPAVRELVRQWWGKTPGFTLATVGLGSPWTALVHGGLVRRVITTFMGEGYPFPTPQALISHAVLEGRLEVSNWSMLTFPLRLLAGAMGVPFLPTRSLLGSTMEEDNARSGDLIAADDPFGAEGRVAYVRALVPDVALLHGWVADRAGNVITGSPLNENMYGAMAAQGGAVVTVEKIVSTDFIRRHADLVRLPVAVRPRGGRDPARQPSRRHVRHERGGARGLRRGHGVDPRVPPRLPQAGHRGRVDPGVDAGPARPRGLPLEARLRPDHGDEGAGPHRRLGLGARHLASRRSPPRA